MSIILYDKLRSAFGLPIVDATDVEIDASGFDGVLSTDDDTLQEVAQALDDLTLGGVNGLSAPEISELTLDISNRVNVGTDLSGETTLRYRVYNRETITSLSLFIQEGGLFQTVALSVPTSNGDNSVQVTLPNIVTSSERNIGFVLVANGEFLSSTYVVRVENIDGDDVVIDDSSLADVTAPNAQDLASEVERLFGVVRQIQQELAMSDRQLNLWDNSVTITPTNLGEFLNRNNIYSAGTNQRVNFVLPAESTIAGQYPVAFEIQHFGGTQRFDTGGGALGPDNTIRITRPVDYDAGDPSTFLRRDTETGTNLVFSALHMGDTAIVTKEDEDSPWVVVEGSNDPRNAILPSGLFSLNSRMVSFVANQQGDHFVGGLSLYTPNQGDAFEVIGSGLSEDSTFGRAINAGDVIVAKIDDPSLLFDENNNDWLIVRDAGSGVLSLTEIRFLSQISESDTNVYEHLEDRGDVSEVRLWLSTGVLDHAPFITPVTDPNNPQNDGVRYGGGDEFDTPTRDFVTNDLTIFGDTGSILPSALMYIDIDGAFDINENINNIFVLHRDRDDTIIDTFSLEDDFRPITLTGSSDTYYVFDDVAAQDVFSSINYHTGQSLEVVIRNTNREFIVSEAVNLLTALKDGTVALEKLEPTVQALVLTDHTLSDNDQAKLDGLETTSNPTPWTAGDLYVKINNASSSNDLSHYVNVGQGNGILPNYERTREVFFLVPNFVTVTELQKVEEPSTKLSVTRIGVITATSGSTSFTGQLYHATLPAITGANDPLNNAWQIDGTASNTELTGADETFKIDENNLSDSLDELIRRPINNPYQLPENLQALSDNMTISTTDERVWEEVQPQFLGNSLEREYALLFDENWYTQTASQRNEFNDIIGAVETLGFSLDDYHYFLDGDDTSNRGFPGRKSYIMNDNLRVRNDASDPTDPIDDTFRKLMLFEYRITQDQIGEDQRQPILRIGDGTHEPFLQYHDGQGLVARISTQDAPQTTRNVNVPTTVERGQWTINNGINSDPTSRIILPDDIVSGQSVPVRISLRVTEQNPSGGFNPLNPFPAFQATEHLDITITNIDNDQTFPNHTFEYAGVTHESVTVVIAYDADSSGRRIITVDPILPLESGHVQYDLSATFSATETFRPGTQFTDLRLPAYNSTGGINKVALLFQKWNENDTDSDPTIGVKMVINGGLIGSDANDYVINTHRRASQFGFDDIRYGGTNQSISRIQTYRYSGHLPTSSDLTTYYNNRDSWVGAFTNNPIGGTEFTINRLEILDVDIPQTLQRSRAESFFRNHLSLENPNASGAWRALSPQPILSGLTRRFALFMDENKVTETGNIFNDITGITFGGFGGRTRYYINPNDDNNRDLPGVQSYAVSSQIGISNTTGETPIPNNYNLIMGFDYSQLGGVLDQSLVRFGGAVEPLLSTDRQGRLVLNIGAQNGASRSRNYEIPISTENSYWDSTTDDVGGNARVEISVPYGVNPPVRARVNLEINGVDSGNAVHLFSFPSDARQNDHNFGSITFDFGGGNTLDVNATYTHSNRTLTLEAANALTDSTLVYHWEGTVSTFEAWHVPDVANHPTQSYHQQVLNLGHSDLRERNRVLFMLSPYRYRDTDSDPEMGLRIIVNNSRGSSTYSDHTFRTYRPASDFDFNNITLGSTLEGGAPTFAIGRIQFYNYDINLPPRSADLLTLYAGLDRYLDAFTNEDPENTRLSLDADMIFEEERGIVLLSANGTRYKLSVDNNGAISTTSI